ncbi:MAG: glycosyl transferase family 4 [Nanoarchaeota archaeon]
MNKSYNQMIAGSGGIIVLLAFLISVLIYVALSTFYFKRIDNLIEILAILLTVMFVGGVGLIDDLLGWQRGGLSKRSRIILVIVAAIPLMAIKAGNSLVNMPFIGNVELGWIYPLLLVPIGIVGATTTFNFLAGFNGLEAGQGILLLVGASIVSYFMGNVWLTIILVCMIFALLAFLMFNWYPARIFPGDVLTYPVGALFAVSAIIGNFEKIALFFFIPFILEFIFKSRGKLIKSSFGVPKKNGCLELKDSKIYGMTHLAIWTLNKMGFDATEKKVVCLVLAFQAFIILLGLIIFRQGIFYV